MSVVTQREYFALMFAAREGKTEIVVELVKAGANVDMQDYVRMSMYHILCTMYMYMSHHDKVFQCAYMYTCKCINHNIAHVHGYSTCTYMYVAV